MPNLNTPITKSITQYEVTAINLAVIEGQATVQLHLMDATGNTLHTITITDTFTAMGIPAGQVNGIAVAVTQFLKQKGLIN